MQDSPFRRFLTSTAIVLAVMVGLGAAVWYLEVGGDADPPAIAEDGDLSAGEALRLVQQSNLKPLEPVVVDAIAEAKRRAFLKEKAAKEKARRKAAWYKKHKKEIDAKLAAEKLAKMPNPSSEQNKDAGRKLNAARGWEACWPALEVLWTKESNWNERADNPWSDAYGIPQALPGSKMSSAGPNWQTNATTQILWGLSYIQARYKDPCGAWSFWQRNNWY